jgi:hypothetical protein
MANKGQHGQHWSASATERARLRELRAQEDALIAAKARRERDERHRATWAERALLAEHRVAALAKELRD